MLAIDASSREMDGANVDGFRQKKQAPPLQTPQGWGTLRVFVICDALRQRLYITDIKCDSRELLLVAARVVVE